MALLGHFQHADSLRSYPKSARITRAFLYASKVALNQLLLLVLIVQLAIPTHLLADPPDSQENSRRDWPPKVDGTADRRVRDLVLAYGEADDENGRLDRAFPRSNLFFVLLQERNIVAWPEDGEAEEVNNGGKPVGNLDISLSTVRVDHRTIEQGLEAYPIEGGIRLRVRGMNTNHVHDIFFGEGDRRRFVSYNRSSYGLDITLSDGSIWCIEDAYYTELFNGRIPLMYVGTRKNLRATRIQVIKKILPGDARAQPLDESERPIDLSDELKRELGHEDPNNPYVFSDGDRAIILGEGREARVVQIISGIKSLDYIDVQTNALHILLSLADPTFKLLEAQMNSAFTVGRSAIYEFGRDERRMDRFFRHGYATAISQVPEAAVRRAMQRNEAILEEDAELYRQGGEALSRRMRHRATYRERLDAFEAYQLAVEQAQNNPEARTVGRWRSAFRGLKGFLVNRVKQIDFRKGLSRLATVLGWGLTITTGTVAADYMLNHGNGVALATDVITNVISWVGSTDSVLGNAQYRGILAVAMLCHLSVVPMLMIAAAAKKKLKNIRGKFYQVLVGTGIRAAGYLHHLNPRHILSSHLINQAEGARALQLGYVRYFSNDPATRESQVEQANREIREDRAARAEAHVYAVALMALAVSSGQDPGDIAMRAKAGGNLATFRQIDEAMELSGYLFLHKIPRERIHEVLTQKFHQYASAYKALAPYAEVPEDETSAYDGSRKNWRRAMGVFSLVRGLGGLGVDTADEMAHARPSASTSGMVLRTLISGLSVCIICFALLSMADLSQPDHLFAQEENWFLGFSNRVVAAHTAGFVLFGLGPAAAAMSRYFNHQVNDVMETYRPALTKNCDAPGTDSFFGELKRWATSLFSFRETQPAGYSAENTYIYRITYGISGMLIALFVRLVFGGQDLTSALKGELTIWAWGFFVMGWLFSFLHPTQNYHESLISNLSREYHRALAGLDQAIRVDPETIGTSIQNMLDLYARNERRLWGARPPDGRRRGESWIGFARRLLAESQKSPPIVKNYSELKSAWQSLERALAPTNLPAVAEVACREATRKLLLLYEYKGALPAQDGISVDSEKDYALLLLEFSKAEPATPLTHREDVAHAINILIGVLSYWMATPLIFSSYDDSSRSLFGIDWDRLIQFGEIPNHGVVTMGVLAAGFLYTLAVAGRTFDYVHDSVKVYYYAVKRALGDHSKEMDAYWAQQKQKKSLKALADIMPLRTLHRFGRFIYRQATRIANACLDLLI